MPNHLDFLVALDRWTRESLTGEVTTGYEMHQIAWTAGLAPQGQTPAAYWTGQLVDLGYVEPGPRAGMPAPIPPRVSWTDTELQAFTNYRVTSVGRQEAERLRQVRREQLTDIALGIELLSPTGWFLSPKALTGIERPVRDVRAALDDGRAEAAIGAAKDLVEAACKVVLAAGGATMPTGTSLPRLFTAASRVLGASDGDLGRSLTATVQRVAELRNTAGSGHGRAAAPDVSLAHARLAASAATAVSLFLLSGGGDLAPPEAG